MRNNPDQPWDLGPKKRKKPVDLNPMARKWLKKNGYTFDGAESYNAHTKRKKDLFGWIDIAALHPDRQGVYGIQITSLNNMGARMKKADGKKAYHMWLAQGNTAMFQGWFKNNRGIWKPEIREFYYGDLLK